MGVVSDEDISALLSFFSSARSVDFVDMTDNGIKFRMESERDILTVPFHRVRSLTSRVGDVIYPKPIHIKSK